MTLPFRLLCFIVVTALTYRCVICDVNSIISDFSEFTQAKDGQFFSPKEESVIGPSMKLYGMWEQPLKKIALSLIDNLFGAMVMEKEHCLQDESCKIIIYDIGANFGSWSIPLAKAIKNRVKVHAFELQGHMMAYLNLNILANKLSGSIHPIHLALSNTTGFIDIHDLYNNHLTNYGAFSVEELQVRTTSAGGDTTTQTRVPMDTLDNLFYQSKMITECPHMIKADIEGHEMNVFVGGQRLLRECQPIILFEADCKLILRSQISLLDSLGYALAWVADPFLDVTAEFNGYSPLSAGYGLYGGLISDPAFANVAVIGGNHIVAVPKKRSKWITELSGSLIAIDVAAGHFLVDDYNIVLCHGDHWCIRREHSTNVVDACHLSVTPEDLDDYIANDLMVNYWKLLQ